MGRDSSWRLLVPGPVRRLPPDVTAVCVLTVLTGLTLVLPVVRTSPIRVLVAIPFVLFTPGYAVVAALFPGEGGEGDIDGIERVALSVAASIALVPLVGLTLYFTVGLTTLTAYLGIAVPTLAVAGVAVRRRRALSPNERLSIPYRSWLARSRAASASVRRGDLGSVLLAVSLLVATVSVGAALVAPPPGDGYTEFYLLTANRTGGLEATDYTEFAPGETRTMYVGIGNEERERTAYTVVAFLGPANTNGNGPVITDNTTELDRFRTVVPSGETWRTPHNVTAPGPDRQIRLTYLLYVDGVPEDPTVENAYREVHLYLNVTGSPAGASDLAGARATGR